MLRPSVSLLVLLVLSASAPIAGLSGDDREHPRSIVSITICSPTGAGLYPNAGCEDGSVDTQQVVRGMGQEVVNLDGAKETTDEHSSVFPPGYLGNNKDYLFFVASGYAPVNPDIGLMVLSGHGPDRNGQWDLQLADGYGDYGAQGRGTVFLSPTSQGRCPDKGGDAHASEQDQTFDLAYAAPGSLFKDPTSRSHHLLMIYEGTNACVGSGGGPKPETGAYETIGVATSLDDGRSWPRYAPTGTFDSPDLPFASQKQGPDQPFGAMGPAVCIGNDCTSHVPSTYGRYRVLSPPVALDPLMKAGQPGVGLGQNVGNAQPSAFLDDVRHGRHDDADADDWPYVYIVYVYVPGLPRVTPPQYQLPQHRNKDIMVARAKLDPEGKPLAFFKWDGTSFADAGQGGLGAGVLQTSDTSFEHCADPAQERDQASIGYVEETRQYLLTFVCNSPGAPHDGVNDSTKQGSVWFFSTTDDLSDQSTWSVPKEITGSWSEWTHHHLPEEARCPVFNGFYPTFMSPGQAPGHLSKDGYVFYLWGSLGGCQDPNATTAPRMYSSRQFRIITGSR